MDVVQVIPVISFVVPIGVFPEALLPDFPAILEDPAVSRVLD